MLVRGVMGRDRLCGVSVFYSWLLIVRVVLKSLTFRWLDDCSGVG